MPSSSRSVHDEILSTSVNANGTGYCAGGALESAGGAAGKIRGTAILAGSAVLAAGAVAVAVAGVVAAGAGSAFSGGGLVTMKQPVSATEMASATKVGAKDLAFMVLPYRTVVDSSIFPLKSVQASP